MKLQVTSNVADFAATFAEYRRVSRKIPGDALAHRAGRMSMRLWDEFRKVRPNVAQIISSARSRNFRVSRKGNSLTPVTDGLSSAAVERARTLLGGRKADYFRVTEGEDGVPQVRLARVGVRNSRGLLTGGRRGNKFAGTARGLSSLYPEQVQSLRETNPDLRSLNLRALSVAIELAYRARAGRGGLLALQFLHQVYQSRKSSTIKNGPLIARTRGGVGIGSVNFDRSGPDGELSEVIIKGTVPGSANANQRFGITNRAIEAETADMRVYISDRLNRAKAQAGLK